jgi:hypothetical protein
VCCQLARVEAKKAEGGVDKEIAVCMRTRKATFDKGSIVQHRIVWDRGMAAYPGVRAR